MPGCVPPVPSPSSTDAAAQLPFGHIRGPGSLFDLGRTRKFADSLASQPLGCMPRTGPILQIVS